MISVERIIWLIVNGISQIISLVFLRFIWNYLDSKPLGMQTTFDLTVKGIIQGFILEMFTTWFTFVRFSASYSPILALAILKVYYFSVIWCYLWGMVILFTRYLIVFHNHLLDRIEDGRYIRVIWWVVWIFERLKNNFKLLDCQNSCYNCIHHYDHIWGPKCYNAICIPHKYTIWKDNEFQWANVL